MKTNFLKSIFSLAFIASLSTSCVDDEYATPTFDCVETTLVKNKEVSEIPATAVVKQYLDDDIIEAYAVSSDKDGNFFKSVSFQTLDGTRAFSVPMDVQGTFTTFEPGRKVLIKMQNLYTDFSNGGIRIGGLFVSNSGTPGVGRLTRAQVQASIVRTCDVVAESNLVQNVSLFDLKNDIYINKLIELDNVQFTTDALDDTYYVEGATNTVGGATNHLLTDNLGSTVIFRTSSFAGFANKAVAQGSGKVRGILTKFGDDYQFVARYESDIMLSSPRFQPLQPYYLENFESISNTGNGAFVALPGWSNLSMNAVSPGERWEARIFSNNKYAQMSAFGTNESNLDVRLITPAITLNPGQNFLKFGLKTSFFNGTAVTAWYSTDYNGANTVAAVNNATWTQLNTIIPTITDNSFAPNFYDIIANLSSLSGQNVYISFRYQGSTTAPIVTTTYQIDNVQILGQ